MTYELSRTTGFPHYSTECHYTMLSFPAVYCECNYVTSAHVFVMHIPKRFFEHVSYCKRTRALLQHERATLHTANNSIHFCIHYILHAKFPIQLKIKPPYCIILTEVFLNLAEVSLTLTEVFPCFFLSCKENSRVKLAKTGHGPHSSTLVYICVVRLLFVLFYVLFVCKCVLPVGDNPIAVNKYHKQYNTEF
jgi:hypothetical protein